jgi:hypothetical protein
MLRLTASMAVHDWRSLTTNSSPNHATANWRACGVAAICSITSHSIESENAGPAKGRHRRFRNYGNIVSAVFALVLALMLVSAIKPH